MLTSSAGYGLGALVRNGYSSPGPDACQYWQRPSPLPTSGCASSWSENRRLARFPAHDYSEDAPGCVHPIVVRDTLGHKQVKQQEAYDAAKRNEVGNALSSVGNQLLPTVLPNGTVQ
jgi:hypothetical protein